MRKRVLAIASLLISVLLLAMMFSGCAAKNGGNTNSSSSTGSQGSSGSNTASKSENKASPVELKIEVFDRGTPGETPVDNNYWTKWIQQQFGDPNNIKLTFVPCPRSEEVDKLNVWMASGDAPDICLTYDVNTVYNYYKNKGLTDLTDALNQYGADLKKFLGDDLLNYGRFDGRQYAIPAKRVIQARTGTFIRKDWLEKLNLPVPETTEQFYETLKAFKEKNPGNVEKVIPFAMTQVVDYDAYGFFEAFREPVSDEEYFVKYRLFLPGYKEGARFLNKMYNEGLISTDFPLDKDGKMRDENIVKGFVGAYGSNYDMALRNVPGHNINLKKNFPDAEFIPCDPYTNKYTGQHQKQLYDPTGIRIIVPAFSKRVNEVIKYLNWMSDPNVIFFLQFGNEGIGHTIVNGLPKLNYVEGEQMFPSLQNIDYTLIVNGIYLSDPTKTIKANAFSYPGNEQLYEDTYNLAMRGGYVAPSLTVPVEAEAKYSKVLYDKEKEIYAKAITAAPQDFDKVWDSMLQEYLAMGGQEVMDQRAAAWKEAHK